MNGRAKAQETGLFGGFVYLKMNNILHFVEIHIIKWSDFFFNEFSLDGHVYIVFGKHKQTIWS